jgi:dUTP pyrophosphatase
VEHLRISIQRLENYPAEWRLPEYATPGSAAVDLRNAGPTLTIPSLGRVLVPTGLALGLPPGLEAQIRPRSGLALHRGIGMPNAPGTIDSDYRGEIRIPLINFDREPQEIVSGERIAQLLIARVIRIEWEEVGKLPPSERGGEGFGSTGR